MATVSGVWKWNDSIANTTASFTDLISFTSNDKKYMQLLVYSGDVVVCYNPGGRSITAFEDGKWVSEQLQVIDFGDTEQTVSDDFYNYFTANAVRQSSEKIYYKSFTYNGSEVYLVNNKSVSEITIDGVTYYPLPLNGLLDSNGLYLMDSDGLFLLAKEDTSSWEAPVQSGTNLSITQVYSATQSGTNLVIK